MAIATSYHSARFKTNAMDRIFTLLVICFIGFISASAQPNSSANDCTKPQGQAIFHGNDIRTIVSTSGHLFQDRAEGLFQVPYTGPESQQALFGGSVWIGGFDDVGNLKQSAGAFRYFNDFDYGSGPLREFGITDKEYCDTWDTVWVVNRNDLLLHLEDYAADGKVDVQRPSIFGWPGAGNKHFESINGFPLSEEVDFGAPFYDTDNDGVYDPEQGDYPHPSNVSPDVQPAVIAWTVFNDNSNIHTFTQGDMIRVEVQQTTYAFSCPADQLLNETVFVSYKLVNRAVARFNFGFLSQWLQPQIGCVGNDFSGSYPQGNAFFMYGGTNDDGGAPDCYGKNPPVLSVTFLSDTMSSCMYINNGAVGTPPPATTDPQPGAPLEFYRYQTASWRDGLPLTYGGTGYDPGSQQDTAHVFSERPLDVDSWSMSNVFAPGDPFGHRIIGSVNLPNLDPYEATTVDIAYSYHRDTTLDNLQNVDRMYGRVEALHAMYAEGFAEQCTGWIGPCTDDCVHSGDADRDGRVWGRDYLAVATGQNLSGPERFGPISFDPIPAEEWGLTDYFGSDRKHGDCNGDGVITSADVGIVDQNFGLQTPWHTPPVIDPIGDDLQLILEEDTVVLGAGGFGRFDIRFDAPHLDSLYGITFAVHYDPAMFSFFTPTQENNLLDSAVTKSMFDQEAGSYSRTEFALDLMDQPVVPTDLMAFRFRPSSDLVLPAGIDSTWLILTDVAAVMADGTHVPIAGQRKLLYVIDETSSTVDLGEQEWSVYPNPSNGSITIQTESSSPISIRVIDQLGVEVLQREVDQSLHLDLPPGIYYVRSNVDGRTQKVVIAR